VSAVPALFESVLVANRGEIACRVIETLRRLGIRSIAVYSDADAGARHVRMADVAVRIGPASAAESYLNVGAIVDAAERTGATAIHPGYGFLSENTGFARACAEAGIVFIGPEPAAIEIMGDKIRAKAHVAERGVAVIPGAGVAGMSDADLIEAAAGVGYPLLIKPSAGGGGKGMTVVERAEDLAAALIATRRVALAAFGDDTLLLERYISHPRHIEVQVLGDAHGSIIHLGERECSLQRRHQKVIEEAPSPLLTEAQRQRMGKAACAVAASVDYRGVGTVEFLVSDDAPDEFYFMEMNTRLQVEHPVTELITGIDLVEQQVLVAAGRPLTLCQDDVVLTGHAIEARLYAEDPSRGFLPSTGTILALEQPSGQGIRVDTSLIDGLVVTADYDPMLAKIVAHGVDRNEALRRLDSALADTLVLGVRTNRQFLRGLLNDPDVRAGRLDTGLIERFMAQRPEAQVVDETDVAALATAALTVHALAWQAGSLWQRPSGWRLGAARPARYCLRSDQEQTDDVLVSGAPDAAVIEIAGDPHAALLAQRGTSVTLQLDGRSFASTVVIAGNRIWVGTRNVTRDFEVVAREQQLVEHRATLSRVAGSTSPEVRTPMPGTVVAVAVATGDTVVIGQLIATIEAMKMEHTMLASTAGVVTIDVSPGDQVALDQVVASISPHEGAAP
jgi:acetyl-CoA/propionyl-CoA carboxylase, biotin carboxylase, biotin carboxyl carrier protein